MARVKGVNLRLFGGRIEGDNHTPSHIKSPTISKTNNNPK
jgi:hypothetical protein